jgi:hypothetical protein
MDSHRFCCWPESAIARTVTSTVTNTIINAVRAICTDGFVWISVRITFSVLTLSSYSPAKSSRHGEGKVRLCKPTTDGCTFGLSVAEKPSPRSVPGNSTNYQATDKCQSHCPAQVFWRGVCFA